MIDTPDTLPTDPVKASKAPAISRAAAVLRLLGKNDAPLGVQAIARELGLVPSTCLYVLRALVAEELVAFDPSTKRYTLDSGVLTLARNWLRRDRFNDLAQPALDRISQEFGLTTLGVQVFGLNHIIVTAMSQSNQNFQLSTQVGSRFPALVSATGRCIAAFGNYPDSELKPRFEKLRWEEAPSWEEWKAQVEDARETGVAVDAGHYISGVTVIAAPVWKGGREDGVRPSHALVAIGLGAGVRGENLPRLKAALQNAARMLSEQMSG
ncbi:IclR family transcriptional regulator [Novosphingobium mangrovi (ex Huang et al. 2023)]|uniref:IclR family transcriptional regulator n=1 Tax=Novosphingobium mangrovi (ex Huang et al. 2023) TaxID=2976432 RepID=A0ABT2I3H9_9SPHN|nr:IclR family transcriptional regulator [Novosphingobium mangrovi (ex Huang et al. 2023)]MCT2399147.1 IclR family transcriptional regulator [Novosphingobium mangrovi (ex Huang et al. 2023)]